MSDDMIKRPLLTPDEEFITLTEVERNPAGAWMAIQEQASHIEYLEQKIKDLLEEKNIDRLYGDERYTDHGRIED